MQQQQQKQAARPIAPAPIGTMPGLNYIPPQVQVYSQKQVVDLHIENIIMAINEGTLSYSIVPKLYSPAPLSDDCRMTNISDWLYKNMLNVTDDAAMKFPKCPARQLMYSFEQVFKAGMQLGANCMQLKEELRKNKNYGQAPHERVALERADFIPPKPVKIEPQEEAEDFDVEELFQFAGNNNSQ